MDDSDHLADSIKYGFGVAMEKAVSDAKYYMKLQIENKLRRLEHPNLAILDLGDLMTDVSAEVREKAFAHPKATLKNVRYLYDRWLKIESTIDRGAPDYLSQFLEFKLLKLLG